MYKTTGPYLFLITFQKSLNILCMTISLITSNVKWISVNMVFSNPNLQLPLDNIDYIFPLVCSQHFYISWVPYGPYVGYDSWFCSYITSHSFVQDLSLSHSCLMYLLITSAILLNTLHIFLFAAVCVWIQEYWPEMDGNVSILPGRKDWRILARMDHRFVVVPGMMGVGV